MWRRWQVSRFGAWCVARNGAGLALGQAEQLGDCGAVLGLAH